MVLVVGLGNPGGEHAGNRHNIGFMALDAVVRRHSFARARTKFGGEVREGEVAGHRLLALKPMTYMNESGRSVGAACRFFKIPPGDVLVLHDEIDLAAGRLRTKRGGGAAGHKGLRSIHAHIGPDYRRLRLGIGHPGERDRVVGHVLKDFAKTDAAWLEPLLEAVAEHFALLVAGDDPEFMNKVSLAIRPPAPSDPPAPPRGGERP